MFQGIVKLLFLLLLSASIGLAQSFAQSFRVGFEGGVPLTNSFDTGTATVIPLAVTYPPSYAAGTRRYTVGATAELSLPFHLAIKADVLYKRLGFDSVGTVGVPIVTTTATTTANSLEFPLLAKYSIGKLGPLSPYVEGGVSFRTLQGVSQTSVTICPICANPVAATTTTHHPSELNHSFTKGIAGGAGLEIKHLPIGLFGEIRYTHWTADAFSALNGLLSSVRNQADLLVGVTF